jgi:hypothetical protein
MKQGGVSVWTLAARLAFPVKVKSAGAWWTKVHLGDARLVPEDTRSASGIGCLLAAEGPGESGDREQPYRTNQNAVPHGAHHDSSFVIPSMA